MTNMKEVKLGNNTRMSFAKISEVLDMPNLIEVQKNSYKWFLEEGLREVFDETDYNGNLVLDFIGFRIDENPKYTVEECKERDVTYAAPIYVRVRLLNKETGEIKESEVFMGDFPIMTDSGTFVINGAERVIVSQLVRSPGVYFDMTHDIHGEELFTSTVIPNRGAWLEYETTADDTFYVRIDKNRKIPVTVLARAMGLSTDAQIKEFFGDDERISATLLKDTTKNTEEALLEIYRKLRPGEPATVDNSQKHLDSLFFDPRRYDISRVGRYKYNKKLGLSNRLAGCTLSRPIIDPTTGEILGEPGEIIDRAKAREMEDAGVTVAYVNVEEHGENREIKIVSTGMVDLAKFVSPAVYDAVKKTINERVKFSVLKGILDRNLSDEELIEALLASVKVTATIAKDNAGEILSTLQDQVLIPNTITVDDILVSINYLNCLAHHIGDTDDIDHLGNRRIRSVGELLQNQFRIGFSRMERVVRERMTLQAQDMDVITPQALINIRYKSLSICK